MNINEIKGAIKVGKIRVGDKNYTGKKHVYHKKKLVLDYDEKFDNDLKKKQCIIIYFFTINDKIYKIGQSSGKGGISACMNFYLGAGQDDPGLNRFAINWLIREELKKKNRGDVYMLYEEGFEIETLGLFQKKRKVFAVSPAKSMEAECLKDFKEKNGSIPPWNAQEGARKIPSHIANAFGEYKKLRSGKNK